MGVGMVDICAKRSGLSPDRIAMRDVLSGKSVSYSELNTQAERCAAMLQAHGAEAGARVAVLCRNRIEFFEVMFACAKVGAILVPLNWRMPAAELKPLLDDCTPRVLIHGKEDAATAHDLHRPGLTAFDLDEPHSYAAALRQAGARRPVDVALNDPWSLLYTSGTTGAAKAVIQTHQMALVNYMHTVQAFGVREHDHCANFLPLFHTGGIQLVTLPTLIAGGVVSVLPGMDAEQLIDLLPSLDVFFGVPAIYQQLAAHPAFERADFSRVRAWGCGGAPLADVLVERFAAKGALVCNGYGMTETGPTAFVGSPEIALSKVGSVGKPQILLEARIVGKDGEDAPNGAEGEIWMRGPGVTPGYWRKPEANAETFTADGWLKSGDLGRRDADGCYYVVARIKDMYISGGENVFPAEVENVLARHPAVIEAAVVGVPDDVWGETGHAFVLLRPGANATPAELAQHCRTHLAAYKAPRGFTFVDDFPRTAAGKVRKGELAPLKSRASASR